MATGLEQTYDTLRQEVGYFLGWGTAPSLWDAAKSQRIDAAIREGLHKFLYNTIAPGTNKVYSWSFLRQTYVFATVADTYAYDLPADFGSPDAHITFAEDGRLTITYINEALLERKRAVSPDASSQPRYAAIKAKTAGLVSSQEFQVLLFPTPDTAYTLQMPYHVNGEMLSAQNLYPRGGPPVARAILLACKAEAALQTNDDRSWEADYQLSLAAAINYDSRRTAGNMGYNGDNSDSRETSSWFPGSDYTVSYNGTVSDDSIGLDDL